MLRTNLCRALGKLRILSLFCNHVTDRDQCQGTGALRADPTDVRSVHQAREAVLISEFLLEDFEGNLSSSNDHCMHDPMYL